MATARTAPTAVPVEEFIAGVGDASQRADAAVLMALLSRLTGEPARMWGPSLIGFGAYTYAYPSGRTGEAQRIGFSPRKGQTVLYLMDGVEQHGALLDRLGKHKTGRSCLYIKELADVDMAVLTQLCEASLAWMAGTYPQAVQGD